MATLKYNWLQFEPAGPRARVGAGTRISIRLGGAIAIYADRSMPRGAMDIISGEQRMRYRWLDEDTELDRWADDGGRAP